MTREELIAAGFVPTTYKGQEGEFLTKKTKVDDLPYAREHIVDNQYIFGESEAITEVTPKGEVQLFISDADYVEGPHPADSEEGKALINDAISI